MRGRPSHVRKSHALYVRSIVLASSLGLLSLAAHADPAKSTPFTTVVQADKPELKEEISRQTLTTEELSKIPGTLGDPLRAIENLPGAARPPLNTGLLIIEGARPSDSRVNLAAAEVPQLYHYGGFTSVVPAGFIASIDYLPHNFGARYGRATAGTIDVELRPDSMELFPGDLLLTASDGLTDLALEVAKKFNIPIAATLLSKSVISETNPLYIGVYSGSLSEPETQVYVEQSDCIIMLGAFITHRAVLRCRVTFVDASFARFAMSSCRGSISAPTA